jgi:ABC-type Fe3+/spermidine/putrescine transport system ATPase subunit
VTAILVTHDQEEALAVSDAIGVMAAGRVLQVGPPADAYERPRTPFVAKFLGSANLLDGRSVGSPSPVVMVRPEHCVLNSSAPCRWQWPGKVTGVTFLGADLLAEVACEGSLSLRVRTRAAGACAPAMRSSSARPTLTCGRSPKPTARVVRSLD